LTHDTVCSIRRLAVIVRCKRTGVSASARNVAIHNSRLKSWSKMQTTDAATRLILFNKGQNRSVINVEIPLPIDLPHASCFGRQQEHLDIGIIGKLVDQALTLVDLCTAVKPDVFDAEVRENHLKDVEHLREL
jgi:hypothetical protein